MRADGARRPANPDRRLTSTVDAVDGPPALARPFDPDQVYVRFQSGVLGYLRAQSVEDPEDVAAEVFLQVVRDLSRFTGDDAALRRWVFTSPIIAWTTTTAAVAGAD